MMATASVRVNAAIRTQLPWMRSKLGSGKQRTNVMRFNSCRCKMLIVSVSRDRYQREGNLCLVERDLVGAGDCIEGLVCIRPDGDAYGRGICTKLVPFAKQDAACLVDLDANACVAGYACEVITPTRRTWEVGSLSVGTCIEDDGTTRTAYDRSSGEDQESTGWHVDWSTSRCVTGEAEDWEQVRFITVT